MDYPLDWTHYPDVDVQFQAEVDAGFYSLNFGDYTYLHILITGEHWKKGVYSYSKEFKADHVILDYDKDGGLIGIEIITKAELGDLKI